MSNQSKQLFDRATRVTPGGVHSPVRALKGVNPSPVFFTSGEGAYLTDVDGHRYIDFCQSFGPLILGHRDPVVLEALQRASERALTLGACEPYSLELCEWIVERIPWVEKLRFVSSGTEATMSALRLARAATGRDKIVKFDGCYHGHSDALLVKAGSGLAGASASSSLGVSQGVAQTTLVAGLDDEANVEAIFNESGSEIAAVIMEPLPANFGLLPQRKEFIQRVMDLARANGSLVIFDEVISGFRMAMGGMAEVLGMQPDLVCYGKIVGGGFPVGCFGGREDLMDMLAPEGSVYQAGTLSANPVGMMTGLATLRRLEELNAFAVLEERTARFTKELETRLASTGTPMNVTRMGSLFWMYVPTEAAPRKVSDIPANQSEVFAQLFRHGLSTGVYLPPSGYEVGFVSMAHTDEVLTLALNAIEQAAQQAHVHS